MASAQRSDLIEQTLVGRRAWACSFFYQTPGRRKIRQSNLLTNVDPEKMAFLLKKQWNSYSLTPLYRFSYAALKSYSEQLAAFITAENQKGIAVEVGQNLRFKVAFSILGGLKGTEQDSDAILIQITSKPQFLSPDKQEKLVWSGWLCCTHGDGEFLEKLAGGFTYFPLLFTNGRESLTVLVGTWLMSTFDCCVKNLVISSLNLTWMAAMWTGCNTESSPCATELYFSVPCSPSLDISFQIHPEDIKALWEGIHQSGDEVTQEEVDLLMTSLEYHFYRHFRIHLSATQLVKIATPIVTAHCDGKVKFLQAEHTVKVLTLLTELATTLILN
nr:PREDICTED: centromere protein L isoform X2 [Latimeria chalumnae]|eukprot:XP_014348261.1 PREDICTED: centromere protein L isoform X2 [Latimeria chalumnae]